MTAEGALGAEGATAQAPGTEWAMGGLARGWGSPPARAYHRHHHGPGLGPCARRSLLITQAGSPPLRAHITVNTMVRPTKPACAPSLPVL